MRKLYVSMHGGEGWENIIDEDKLSDEIDAIQKHWNKVPRESLVKNTFVFPLDSRIEVK